MGSLSLNAQNAEKYKYRINQISAFFRATAALFGITLSPTLLGDKWLSISDVFLRCVMFLLDEVLHFAQRHWPTHGVDF